jgi:GT2 family glycosyltransferase
MKNYECCIIILNWNSWQNTLNCLMSLRSQIKDNNIAIIICDNASTDGSYNKILKFILTIWGNKDVVAFAQIPTYLEKYNNLSLITLLQTGNNLGYAGGNNVGINYALQNSNAEYIWVLNNDTYVDKHALNHLLKCASNKQNNNIGIFGSTIMEMQNPDIIQCAGGCSYLPLLSKFNNVLGGKKLVDIANIPNQDNLKIDYISGASMFIRTKVIKQIGLLNEEYFLYYEELDYTKRLKKANYGIYWCKDSLVYHYGGASTEKKSTKINEQLIYKNYYENLSTLKYTKNFHNNILYLVMLIRFILKSLVIIKRRQFFLFKPLFDAYLKFIFFK